jgi:hypothetical protein
MFRLLVLKRLNILNLSENRYFGTFFHSPKLTNQPNFNTRQPKLDYLMVPLSANTLYIFMMKFV